MTSISLDFFYPLRYNRRMQLTPFNENDFNHLQNFMQPLWEETYASILPKAQIAFLVHKYFSQEGIAYFRALGYQYRKIDDIGVVIFVDKGSHIFMDKLYLLPQARGKNYPAFVFSYLASFGKDVMLNVNQKNERALKCYLKNGFVIEEKKDVDFGDGMVNHDYVMRRKASPANP